MSKKRKDDMIISINTEKLFDKMQHSHLWLKILSKLKRELLQLDKELKGETRKRCALSSLLLKLILEILACAIRDKKYIKGIKIEGKWKYPYS